MSMISVQVLRDVLVAHGMTRQEVTNIKGKYNLIQKVNELGITTDQLLSFANGEHEDEAPPEKIEFEAQAEEKTEEKTEVARLTKFSPEWNAFMMSLFHDDELFPNPVNPEQKLPNINGLRRVGHLMLPDIVCEKPVSVNTTVINGEPFVSVIYQIVFSDVAAAKYVNVMNPQKIEVCATGDCWIKNAPNGVLMYATAIAETRAENRAWKKALGLTIPTFEEFAQASSVADAVTHGEVKDSNAASEFVKVAIKAKCEQLGIDTQQFLRVKYSVGSLDNATVETARAILQQLNDYQNIGSQEIPSEFLKK